MSSASIHLPVHLSSALDRAAGYASALRALGIYLQDFEAGESEALAITVLSNGLADEIAILRKETNVENLQDEARHV